MMNTKVCGDVWEGCGANVKSETTDQNSELRTQNSEALFVCKPEIHLSTAHCKQMKKKKFTHVQNKFKNNGKQVTIFHKMNKA
jgi:hypothetical protein